MLLLKNMAKRFLPETYIQKLFSVNQYLGSKYILWCQFEKKKKSVRCESGVFNDHKTDPTSYSGGMGGGISPRRRL